MSSSAEPPVQPPSQAQPPAEPQPEPEPQPAGRPAGGPVRVTVTRSGGFAGISRTWQVAAGAAGVLGPQIAAPAPAAGSPAGAPAEPGLLGDGDADRLRAMVDALDGQTVAALGRPADPVPDGFLFEIAVERPQGSWSAAVPDEQAPPPLADLLAFVREHGG